MEQINELDFQVAFGAVRHFGRNLYTTNPPAIAELVANAWDAYAQNCTILIGDTGMLIVDDGIGMTDEEFQHRYATTGNEKNTNVRKPNKLSLRPYMGKKGIGKFSAFSLANEYWLYTKSEEDSHWKKIELKKEILQVESPTLKVPITRILDLTELTNKFSFDFTKLNNGTIIYLPNLIRGVTAATLSSTEKLLSRRFSITTVLNDGNFKVAIGEKPIDLESHFFYNSIEYLHYFGFNDEEIKERFPKLDDVHRIKENDYIQEIKGWVATVEMPASLIVEDETAIRGVSVFINGKLVDEDILRNIKKDRMTDSYIIGEVDANYLGLLSEDVVLSNREGLFLDNKEVSELKTYIEGVRKSIVSKWDEMRSNRKTDKQKYILRLTERKENKKYYEALDDPEKSRFNKYAQKLFDKPSGDEDEGLVKLSNLMFSALLQIVNDESLQLLLCDEHTDESKILECFNKIFNLTEVNHALRLRDSIRNNLSIIKELEGYIASGEVEKVFEKHLAKNPWLIEPTWISKVKSVHTQDYFKLLNIDNSSETRLYTDLIVEVSDEIYPVIVEIKREKATNYSVPDVNQICNQLYNYQKALSEKLTLEIGKTVLATDIKTYFICGQTAFNNIDPNDRNRLDSAKIKFTSYDFLIRTAKRIFEVNFGDDIADI